MQTEIIAAIERRYSANSFDGRPFDQERILKLARLATRAPTAYNLQNWRFIAVATSEAKSRLQAAAYGQAKVSSSAVTYIVCGQLPSAGTLGERLQPSVDAGIMSATTVGAWVDEVEKTYGNDVQRQRDEAIRSGTLGASFLMLAAAGMGLDSAPMAGFDSASVAREFHLSEVDIPVMLVAVGYAGEGNRPQKPRLDVSRVLEVV
jgi:nitroreductase